MNERDDIERACLDYFEGWFEGDAARMERALHPDLAKRSLDGDGESVKHITAAQMVDATERGVGKSYDLPDRGIDVEIHEVYRNIANVTVRSAVYREYVQLAHTRNGWKVVNTLWQRSHDAPGA